VLGWVFVVEEAITIIQTAEGKSMFGSSPPETGSVRAYYVPCSFAGSGAPACGAAKTIEDRRSDGTWPSPDDVLGDKDLP
jgi:hypothetical protein